MSHGTDYSFSRYDEFGMDSVRLEQNTMPDTDAAQLGQWRTSFRLCLLFDNWTDNLRERRRSRLL